MYAAALAWYGTHARELPWRVPGTPAWHILISEVMLQQTPVARVLAAYEEWTTRWPTPADLAAEPVGEAIRAWGKLGYPRRGKWLHESAVAMLERHGGQVPDELNQLLALPGIGDYTARAVLSFAYGQRHPVIDTNVRRLIARALHGVEDKAIPLAAVEELLPEDPATAATTSAAFMELGALICTARSPKCADCPYVRECAWKAAGSPLPDKPFRRPQSFAGTDRQVRGLLLAVLRESAGPVPKQRLDVVWQDTVQRERALKSLVTDGLVTPHAGDVFALPGNVQTQ
jgi:A/G-specific adenine glycosylase